MRLAADANVLLSAVLGGRARLILQNPRIDEILTAQATFAEVQEYAALLARRKRLSVDLVVLAVASLPVTIVEPGAYADSAAEARRRIGKRDLDDVELLALAIQFDLAVWSNDKDFGECGVRWYTTQGLLRELGLLRER